MQTVQAPHVRWMISRDMPEILAIEAECFPGHEWTEEDFRKALSTRNQIGMVAEQKEEVVGFLVYQLHKSGLRILNFAVSPAVRRRLIGAALVSTLIRKLSDHHRLWIVADVRERNLRALHFFKAQGFRAVNVLRGHYEDEDAIRMVYRHRGDA